MWVPLRERRSHRREAIRHGTLSIDTSLAQRLASRYRHCAQGVAATSFSRVFVRFWPFHKAYVVVGCHFGSAIQGFFGFSERLLLLNLALGLVWLPLVVVPQLLLTPAARHMGDDLLAIFGLNQAAYAERFRQGRPADPQLLYMGGYRPEIEDPDGLLTADRSRYHMGTAYLCALGATYIISLVWIVRKLGALMAEGGSAGGRPGDATGKILELIFAGWDWLEAGPSATRAQRYTLVKQLGEELETATVSDNTKLTVSRQHRRNLQMWRALGVFLSTVLLGAGVFAIFWALSSGRDQLESVPGLGPLMPTLVISAANALVPTVIKLLVDMEGWDPDSRLRQATVRIFLIKMVNLVVLFAEVHSSSSATDARLGEPCAATTAGATFMQLLISEFFVASFSAVVPKLLIWKLPKFDGRGRLPKVWWLPFGFKQPFDLPKEVIDLVYRQARRSPPRPPRPLDRPPSHLP